MLRPPGLLRTSAFRLTLLFLALFGIAAGAFLTYVYAVSEVQVTRAADAASAPLLRAVERAYIRGGRAALEADLAARSGSDEALAYALLDPAGRRLAGGVAPAALNLSDERNTVRLDAVSGPAGGPGARDVRGVRQRLTGGEILFVGVDVTEGRAFAARVLRGLWGAGALVLLLGLAGGLAVSRNVSRDLASLNAVIAAVDAGDLRQRARVRGTADELDELAGGLNGMLDRLERSMASVRQAGEAIAHDLRSPLTRLRTRLEVTLLDVEAGRGDARAALVQAVDDLESVLKTFSVVLAIARLEAAGEAPDQRRFDPADVARDILELYQPVAEERGIALECELEAGLWVRGNPDFIAQALANIVDNAVKYGRNGGAVMLRVRRRASGEAEFSVTDTGPGVPAADRSRIIQRFVRLEHSRNAPGAGLGLSLVQAVASAHRGRLEIDEGPGVIVGSASGPGLRVAFILPRAT